MKYIGWLSPYGDLIPCEGCSHMDKADEIARVYNIYDNEKQSDETLLKRGWVRISRITYGDEGLMFWMPYFLTTPQYCFFRKLIYEEAPISQKGYEILLAYHIFE